MDLWRAHLGSVSLARLASGEVSAWDQHTGHVELADGFRRVAAGEHVLAAITRGPFEVSDLGRNYRLAWPAGACELAAPELKFWRGELALWRDRDRLVAVDAARPDLLVVVGLIAAIDTLFVHGDALWIEGARTATRLAITSIRALFDHAAGALAVTVHEHYPFRLRDHGQPAMVRELAGEHAIVHAPNLRLRLPPLAGLRLDEPVTLRDRLYSDRYLAIEVPGQPPQSLEPEPPTRCTVALAIEHAEAIDPLPPLGGVAAPPARRETLDRLFVTLVEDREDIACRQVLVDALEEAGAAYAPLLGALVAGDASATTRAEALGAFARFFDRIEYRCGLPYRARIMASAPPDVALAELLAADLRLGLFETIRLGEAPSYELYNTFITSPRAVALRHVDVPNQRVLAALKSAGRGGLRRISGVKFASREVIIGLCDPLFDSVTEFELEVSDRTIAGQLGAIARDEHGFFARAPRQLVISAADGTSATFVQRVIERMRQLPVESVTIADVTLFRDGTAVVPGTGSAIEALVLRQFRVRGS